MLKPIQTLVRRTFKQNKGRNLVAVLAVILTTLMFTTLFVLTQSISKNMLQMTFRQTGFDAQVSCKNITEEQLKLIQSHEDVTKADQSLVLGIATNEALAGRQLEIRWADDSYATHTFAFPSTGTMPQAENEIALDTLTLDKMGLSHELGQTVTLEWRMDPADPQITRSTFTLCGYWEGNQSSYASMAWVSRGYADDLIANTAPSEQSVLGMLMAQFHLKSDRNIEKTMEGILADTGLTDLPYSVNLAYSPEMNAQAAQESMPMYLGMVLVFIAGYLIIYNIFQISVTADIQFYGKLKTLGTTTKQLKRLIYGQANRISLIAIPIGLLLGYLLGMVLVPVLVSWNQGQTSVSASPIIFIGSALFAWLTVLISCLRPARLAGKVSPIEALRYSEAGTGSKKQSKKRRGGASISAMAWANLGRNKKRTVIVICSLTLGLVLLSCFYAKNAAFDMEQYLATLTISDFMLTDASSEDRINGYNPYGTTLNTDLQNQVDALAGLEGTGHIYSSETVIALDEQMYQNITAFYTEELLSDYASYDPNGADGVRQAMDTKESPARIFGADGIPLQTITKDQYLLDGQYDAALFAEGNHILAIGPAVSKGEKPVLPTCSVGDQITLEGKTFTVMAILFPLEPFVEGASSTSFKLDFILPTDSFRMLWPDNTLRKLYFNVADGEIDSAQTMIDTYIADTNANLPVTSRETMVAQYERQTRSSAVMGNAISVIIALVGILNFINSMVTAIVSRKREFAMIQSIGTTKKQLRQMLIFEGLDYALLTLLISYIASALAVGIGVRAIVAEGYTTFHFTLLPLFICTPILLVLAVLIPYLCFRNLEKQSIVERLRME